MDVFVNIKAYAKGPRGHLSAFTSLGVTNN